MTLIMHLKAHETLIHAPSVEEGKQWIAENAPDYFERYHGHCYLICDQPNVWETKVQSSQPVHSRLVDGTTLGFHLLAEVDAGTITCRKDVGKWFSRSLASVQGLVKPAVIERVLDDLLRSQMLYESGGRLFITDIGRISAVWYYRPEDVFCWWKGFEWVESHNLWDNDAALAWAVGCAPSYNMDYVPKTQAKQVEAYMKELNKVVPYATAMALPADLYDQITGKPVQAMRISAFKYDCSRVFQALRQIAKACGWERPEGFWHMLETRFAQGATKATAELAGVEGLGVMTVRKLTRFGVKSLEDLLDKTKRHKVERLLGAKAELVLASARQQMRLRYHV